MKITGFSPFTILIEMSLLSIALMKSVTYLPLRPRVASGHSTIADSVLFASPLSVSPELMKSVFGDTSSEI